MSRSAKINAAWADADYDFRLGLAQIEELQEKTDCGLHFLFNRIGSGQWLIRDLRETIRLGLIGAGMEAPKAKTLIERYFDPGPYASHTATAQAILAAALIGAPDGEEPGKAGAARPAAKRLKKASSPLPPSTEPPQQ